MRSTRHTLGRRQPPRCPAHQPAAGRARTAHARTAHARVLGRPARRGAPARLATLAAALVLTLAAHNARCSFAQVLSVRHGNPVPADVRTMYAAGLKYLVETQQSNGSWTGSQYGDGPGVDGLCLMAMLSCGEDPNFGAYAENIRKTVRSIIGRQSDSTGFIAQSANMHGSMYHHGFATLALAEAYGAVDDRLLWKGSGEEQRPIGKALELAVGALLTSQDNNPHGAWRYTPTSRDADTSCSGACLMALLAARNAGLEIPDASIDKALAYFEKSTLKSGIVAYSAGQLGGGDDSMARASISCLVFAVAKRKDAPPHRYTIENLSSRISENTPQWKYYTRYYLAQALFQGDFDVWKKWNDLNIEILREEQQDNGSFDNNCYATAMCLLSLALNYRFLPIYER